MSTTTDRRVALITGGNKGIGFEIARALGRQGMTVLVGARDPGRGEAAAAALRAEGIDAHPVQLDVTDEGSVRAAAAEVGRRFGRLDALVNNAGVSGGWDQPPSGFPVARIRDVFDTNFFGAVAVAQAFLPLVRNSPAGRVVNVSSGLGSLAQCSDPGWFGYAFNAVAYNTSKSALNAFTVALAKELKDTPVKVNAADPDYCATDLNGHSGPNSAAAGADTPAWLATLPADGPTGGFFNGRKPVPW